MLRSENYPHRAGIVVVMSDMALILASVKTALQEIAKQSAALGIGLQNAAPGDPSGTPNNSVQYLLTTSESLAKMAKDCDKLLLLIQGHEDELKE
ncbi:MAG: hypothetical protein H0W64_08025 [Gammaproteobacteria bacterium]|nr:hypothetical protein [Gammaproteobacteria bacterium]